jgi:hypothetical protein
MSDAITPDTVATFRSIRAPAPAFSLTSLNGLGGHRDPQIAQLVLRIEAAADNLYATCLRSDSLINLSLSIDEQVAAIGSRNRRLDSARQDFRDALAEFDRCLMQREPADA